MPEGEGNKRKTQFFLVAIKLATDIECDIDIIEDAIVKYMGSKNVSMIHVEDRGFKG